MHDRIRRCLEETRTPYQVHVHKDLLMPIRSPHDVAQALGYEIRRITKTLLLEAKDREQRCLIVAPSNQRIDLHQIAAQMGCKRLQLADRTTLLELLDYPPNGISPIGAGSMSVFIDGSLMAFPTILIGAGEAGVEIELSPRALQAITAAKLVLP
ncbi:MAG: YbaK/EbsC family protein [Lyngbya sp. HA4199-MV5]|jgi:Cys-tRNA(Pro)/Cys-tRNA(Cys) deacylase|nr:YbaK/EbsC family protein [Lyngbya sp. HA4199-MV5]